MAPMRMALEISADKEKACMAKRRNLGHKKNIKVREVRAAYSTEMQSRASLVCSAARSFAPAAKDLCETPVQSRYIHLRIGIST
jgi:hypothetical protein